MKILGPLGVIILFFLPSQDPAWKKVNHSKFSFTYPTEWDLRFEKDSSKGFDIKLPGKYSPRIRLTVYHFAHKRDLVGVPVNYGDQETTLEIKRDSSALDGFKSDSSEVVFIPNQHKIELWKRISIDTNLINGQEYVEAIHLLETERATTKRVWRIYDKANFRYNLIFEADTTTWRNYESDVYKIFESFTLK